MNAGVAHRRILLLEKFLRLGRPGHQLTIEAEPVSSQFIPETRRADGHLKANQKLALQLAIREETTASAGIYRSKRSLHDAEAFLRNCLVFA